MEFRLHSLPYLAIKEILTFMNLQEQFLFSITSKASKRLVRSINQDTRLTVVVLYGIQTLSNQREKVFVESRENGPTIEIVECATRDIVFWRKPLTSIMEHIVEAFQSKVHLSLSSEFSHQEKLKFLEELRVKIHSVYVTTNQLQETLDALRNIPKVELNYKIAPNDFFENNGPYNFDSIELVFFANNVPSPTTRRSILFSLLDCRRVYIPYSDYSTRDLVEFLGKWIRGSKMENLKISFKKHNFKESIFEELGQVIPVTSAVVDGKKISHPCFLIKQHGTGTKAIVYTHYGNVILRTDFKMIL
uniref:F-box domain-containing protein n=1 Tax=Caenorhabditis tropicalis TaxID=1561998 RepID=A0A1I7UTH6_9PELO